MNRWRSTTSSDSSPPSDGILPLHHRLPSGRVREKPQATMPDRFRRTRARPLAHSLAIGSPDAEPRAEVLRVPAQRATTVSRRCLSVARELWALYLALLTEALVSHLLPLLGLADDVHWGGRLIGLVGAFLLCAGLMAWYRVGGSP